jgi:hypothetical protein
MYSCGICSRSIGLGLGTAGPVSGSVTGVTTADGPMAAAA